RRPLLVLIAAASYLIVANVFYTCGWILELLVAKVWRVRTPVFGPIAVTLGTALSVVVTLVPAGLVILLAVFTSCHGLLGAPGAGHCEEGVLTAPAVN